MSEPLSVCGCCGISFILALFILVGIPFIEDWITPQSVKDREHDISSKNRKLLRDKIKELESKARQGDLIAYEEWKELTGREW